MYFMMLSCYFMFLLSFWYVNLSNYYKLMCFILIDVLRRGIFFEKYVFGNIIVNYYGLN